MITVSWPSKWSDPLEIGRFSLITGPNGSGKTRFLKAMASGEAHINPAIKSDEILYFSFELLRLPANLTAEGRDPELLTTDLQRRFVTFKREATERVSPQQNRHRRRYPRNHSPVDFYNQIQADKVAIDVSSFTDEEKAYHEEIIIASDQLKSRSGLERLKAMLIEAERDHGRPLLGIAGVDFRNSKKFDLLPVSLFQPLFADQFVAYRNVRATYFERFCNDLRISALASGRQSVQLDFALIDQRFLKEYGPPPWETFNQTLSGIGLPFEIAPPLDEKGQNYTPQLYHVGTAEPVDIGEMSSGESHLLALAMCAYNSQPNSARDVVMPKLVLLDEVDACLHPEMARRYLKVIDETLNKTLDIYVVATTHAPSTVALAPEGCHYTIVRPDPRPKKTSKEKALQALLAGVPSLALSYGGRRFVFVESRADATVFGNAYKHLQGHLNSERTLEFVHATAKSMVGSDYNGGRDVVRNVVSQLSGNEAVFGLIDWDIAKSGGNEPSGRVRVLAINERDGLENLLFDPLIIAFMIMHGKIAMIGGLWGSLVAKDLPIF